ncbi:unnamed protein product [Tuber aestivum]|uniref:Uncharacterized protein n=1 Tax=Tuber aestivum TaxID=59557 RepID=A0A292Q7A4_9PEZI|nr:unnamed protein product [Tuber aestivum]
MGPVLPHASATLAVKLTAGQENEKPETMVREASVKPLLKKAIKGGGSRRKAWKKRGRKKKVVEEDKEEGSEENVAINDIKDVVFVGGPINGSPGDAEASVGGDSGDPEYGNQSPVAGGSVGKLVSPMSTATRKTAGASLRRSLRVYARKFSAGKSPANKRGKRTSGRKGKTMVEDSAEESSIHLVDPEDGYYPDDNDEDYEEAPRTPRAPRIPRTPRTPTKTVYKGIADGSGRKDGIGRTTWFDKRTVARATDRRAIVIPTGGRAPIASESVQEQEMEEIDVTEDCEIIELVRTVGTKRPASESPNGGFKKVARTTGGKKVMAIKDGVQAIDTGDSDLDVPEAPSSQSPASPASPNTGYSVESGYSEQRPATSPTQPRSVIQSEPVIGRDRLRYGGKSVAGLRALWGMGIPEYLKK